MKMTTGRARYVAAKEGKTLLSFPCYQNFFLVLEVELALPTKPLAVLMTKFCKWRPYGFEVAQGFAGLFVFIWSFQRVAHLRLWLADWTTGYDGDFGDKHFALWWWEKCPPGRVDLGWLTLLVATWGIRTFWISSLIGLLYHWESITVWFPVIYVLVSHLQIMNFWK